MCNINPIIKKHFLLMVLAVICLAAFSLSGCGGDGDGGGDDDGDGSPAYSELNVSFGGVVIEHFADQTISLQNAGSINITLGDVEEPVAPFTLVADGCSGTILAPSGTCDLQVRFEPTEQGPHEGFFTIPLSGSSTDFAGVNLDGTGNGLNLTITQVDTSACSSVKLIASVTDQDDEFVSGLEGNFTLFEDVSGVSKTVQADTSDVSVVLALDSSGSVEDVLDDIKAAAKDFVDALDTGDEVAIFKFSETADEVIDFTAAGDAALDTAIDSIATASGDTALYDALIYVCDYFDTATPPAANERRAIVLITDGEDTASSSALEAAIADAQDAGIPIFVIGMGAETEFIPILQELSEDTGGQYFDAPIEDVLAEVYPDIAELLTNQYELEYTSNSSGGATVTVNLTVQSGGMTGEDSREFTGCP